MDQCKGVTTKGEGCKIYWDLDERGYCKKYHSWQGLPKCQGFKIGTEIACRSPAKKGLKYCCEAHKSPNKHIDPSVLNPMAVHFRSDVQADVVVRWHSRDVYNRGRLDLVTPYALDLDHIAEKQIFTTALSMTKLHRGDKDLAIEVLRDDVVNKGYNLCLTDPNTNRIKGDAVYNFMDDWRTGHLAERNFTAYLLDGQRNGVKLTRAVSGRITREMGLAMKKSQRKISDEGDTPVLDRVSEQLQELFVAMELKAPRKK
ncbi:hypothetical protein DVH05_028405 [Phytophthora capsici]|nr:hypothetical protein DVH05_028405 [Phytophthora capsici]